jgi:hypothetical protein
MVRWILTPVAAILMPFAVGLLAGLIRDGLLSLCPPEHLISDHCNMTWFVYAKQALFVASLSLSAVGVVIIPALLAPSRRLTVATLAYLGGATVATYFLIQTSSWNFFVFPAIGGTAALCVAWINWRARIERPDDPLQKSG